MARQYEVLVGALNLRIAPGGTIIATLSRASRVEETGSSQVDASGLNWIAVKLLPDGPSGFVVDKYVHALDALGQHGPEATTTGDVTAERLHVLAPTSKPWIVNALAEAFKATTAPYGIAGNPRRMCHFLAQAAHESAGFRTLEEFGGEPWWTRYEGRADLGNTQAGDGVRYHGRGLFQLTGRANYRSMGGKVSRQLEDEPMLAAEPDVSLQTACEYWKTRKLEAYADKNDIQEITRRINGGFNGLAERQAYFRRAWSIWGNPGTPAGI
jgi:predicted chitinase